MTQTDDARLQRQARNLVNDWYRLHSKRPQVLYHYTTARGLMGLLETNRIWATNSRFTNDPTEIEYATRLVAEVAVNELAGDASKSAQRLRKQICDIVERYERHARVYVSCFCTDGDLLSQWRGYGAVGGGYSIGLLAKHLGETEITNPPQPILRQVVYDRRIQERFVRKWVRLLRQARGRRVHLNLETYFFGLFLSECLNCYKDPAYEEENEWRVIQFGRVSDEEVMRPSFREGSGRILPYLALDLTHRAGHYKGRLPVRVVRFGPTLEPRTTKRSLELLCSAHGYSPRRLSILKSEIPFTG